jgi:Arm DNA-binding domain/Phage integrase central domain
VPRILTEAFIKYLKPAAKGKRYSLSDAMVPGLQVRVTETGTKTFLLWLRLHPSNASASALALGKVGQLSLADARAKARRWLELLKSGIDPREGRHVDTFAKVMEDYLERHVKGQRKAVDVERDVRRELLTRWGSRPITKITRRDVIAMAEEIKDRGAPYQARNVLGHALV